MEFQYPHMLLLLILVIPAIVWYIYKESKTHTTITFSSLDGLDKLPKSYKYYLIHALFGLRIISLSLLVIVLARPQYEDQWQDESVSGLDIVIALDVSTSMLAEDFKPNRLEASKDVAVKFISGRRNDKIGLVVFAGESFTQCPLTTDHAVLMNLFKDIKDGMIEDGTAIGMGLANAVNRLKESEAKTKLIILLTDGENTKGEIDPLTAAEIAKQFGIRVYTIGVGTNGPAPYPVKNGFGISRQTIESKIDEPLLKKISKLTEGKYFRATNKSSLEQIYVDIDKLEKTKTKVQKFSVREELYLPFALFALGVFMLELLLRYTIFRRIP